MNKEKLKEIVGEILEKMNCKNIFYIDNGEDSLSVLFDSSEVISFKAETPGWQYSGIQLDETKQHEFKIKFEKN